MIKYTEYKYHLAALFTVTVWGATFVSTKVLIANSLTPAEIFLLRFAMAYVCILPFARGRRWAANLRDELLLAAAGFTVDLYEQDCVIAALLKDALDRAADDPALAAAVSRMRLHAGEDSIAGLRHTAELIGQGELTAPDVVYLDPMFPERTKSAAVKKKFQLLHHLEQPCADEETLVEAALAVHPRKVVIKRPVKGPLLAGVKPSYQLAGKAVRYDVLVPPRP